MVKLYPCFRLIWPPLWVSNFGITRKFPRVLFRGQSCLVFVCFLKDFGPVPRNHCFVGNYFFVSIVIFYVFGQLPYCVILIGRHYQLFIWKKMSTYNGKPIWRLPYCLLILGQNSLSKQFRPKSDCSFQRAV